MAKTFLCIQCSQEFSSDEDFQKHKESGHTTKGTPVLPPNAQVSQEFLEAVQRIENPPIPETPPTPEAPKLPDPRPIMLLYKYTGDCTDCRREPTTITVDTEGGYFAIAYCSACNKQLMSKKVEKL